MPQKFAKENNHITRRKATTGRNGSDKSNFASNTCLFPPSQRENGDSMDDDYGQISNGSKFKGDIIAVVSVLELT